MAYSTIAKVAGIASGCSTYSVLKSCFKGIGASNIVSKLGQNIAVVTLSIGLGSAIADLTEIVVDKLKDIYEEHFKHEEGTDKVTYADEKDENSKSVYEDSSEFYDSEEYKKAGGILPEDYEDRLFASFAKTTIYYYPESGAVYDEKGNILASEKGNGFEAYGLHNFVFRTLKGLYQNGKAKSYYPAYYCDWSNRVNYMIIVIPVDIPESNSSDDARILEIYDLLLKRAFHKEIMSDLEYDRLQNELDELLAERRNAQNGEHETS